MGALEPALVFAGFMGAGKSSAARSVAAELGVRANDSDHELERELGEPIDTWFDRHGEAEFRRVEEQVVLRLLQSPDVRVLSLGGEPSGPSACARRLRRTSSCTSTWTAIRPGGGPAAARAGR